MSSKHYFLYRDFVSGIYHILTIDDNLVSVVKAESEEDCFDKARLLGIPKSVVAL